MSIFTAVYILLIIVAVCISVRTVFYARQARQLRDERDQDLSKLEEAAKQLSEGTDDNLAKSEEVNQTVHRLTAANHIVNSLIEAVRRNGR